MRLFPHITVLVALQIIHSIMGQETDSAFSCALTKDDYYQGITTAVYNIFNPSGTIAAEGYVFFYLHTKEKPEEQEIIVGDSESIKKSTFNKNRLTKIITHGYLSSKKSSACRLPRDALLKSGDYNVIIIDWWNMQSILGTVPLDYWTVAGYVPEVGHYVAKMINFLENHGMHPKNTTLIGHSLGAHVMGIAGYNTNSKVNYIVGLDPALPEFENKKPGARVSREDAEIVEVIHTNGGHCGMPNDIGHHDFYPNGGSKQAGCTNNKCSHTRAYEYYAESIYNETGFCGRKCDDLGGAEGGNCFGHVAIMGGHSKKASAPHGIYHLKTKASSPYAMGMEQ